MRRRYSMSPMRAVCVLEIVALRQPAESRLGETFDIREFHDRLLEIGTLPLVFLRAHLERWLERRSP